MGQRGRKFVGDDPGHRAQPQRCFAQHDDIRRSQQHVIVQLGDDPQPASGAACVEHQFAAAGVNVVLIDCRQPRDIGRQSALLFRIGLEAQRCGEIALQLLHGLGQHFAGQHIAFPEFHSVAPQRLVMDDRSKNEAPVVLGIVGIQQGFGRLGREVSALHEIDMIFVLLGIDEVQFRPTFRRAVDHEHHLGKAGIAAARAGPRQSVELRLAGDAGKLRGCRQQRCGEHQQDSDQQFTHGNPSGSRRVVRARAQSNAA